MGQREGKARAEAKRKQSFHSLTIPTRLLSSEKIADGVAVDRNEFPVVAWAAIALTEQSSVSDAAFTKGRMVYYNK